MKISVIIPTLNEETNIARLVKRLFDGGGEELLEVIVVDSGSTDNTVAFAKKEGAKVLLSKVRRRATQMNLGAKAAKGEVYYFVHGDTLPPINYMEDIQEALSSKYPVGCFWFKFDSPKKIFIFHNYMTHLDKIWCRGGDQSLFVTRAVFEELGGYRDDYLIMEEYDFIAKAQEKYDFKIIPNEVLVSPRKYEMNGYLRVQLANTTVFTMYRLGFSQEKLAKTYRRMLSNR